MPRSRAVLTAPIVLAIVLGGVFAIRSRGAENADLDTDARSRCAPVAGADVVATKPATPVKIDVLANDADADGDKVVVQIVKVTGGTAVVDDATTPFDPDDDRVVFTPADPPPPQAVVEYQAVDPEGATGSAELTVFVNADGVLPAGVVPEPAATAPRCGSATPSTAPGPATTLVSPGTTIRTPGTTARGSSGTKPTGDTGRRTTTTTRRPTVTPTTTPAVPPTTSAPTGPTTTRPSGPPPTTPPQCGPFPAEGSDAQQEAWAECVENNTRP